ncbi:hypothetical protein FA13DRAFT_1761458 [Coprinellus micaceus]|uniref:Uncharacterized protein n=1 Tax=Coprinellus micaceus TaxID=71717 RepID=A0A4Y7TX99_COPMI|nr:hypothetical protein FA13DRAFT_1761458 [Coprinellus micaceus]
MSMSTMSNFINPQSSLCPANGRRTVGDGAAYFDNSEPSVLAVCHLQDNNDIYYYSTTYSGGPGPNALQTEDSPASSPINNTYTSKPLSSSPTSLSFSKSHYHPSRAIPISADSGSDCSSSSSLSGSIDNQDALDFLMTLFPQDGLKALPYAKRVSISAPNLGADFDGVVLELPGKPKTLYVDGKGAPVVNLRESIVAFNLLHSLMYVGGTVVTAPVFKLDPAFVLVGLEI